MLHLSFYSINVICPFEQHIGVETPEIYADAGYVPAGYELFKKQGQLDGSSPFIFF